MLGESRTLFKTLNSVQVISTSTSFSQSVVPVDKIIERVFKGVETKERVHCMYMGELFSALG